jgi:hypothetical protein
VRGCLILFIGVPVIHDCFLAYVNNIWSNIESKIRLFADDCIIYRKILNISDIEKLQTDLDKLGVWAEGN